MSGNGTAAIDGTATLDLGASATINVLYGSGAGTLKLGDAFHFNGTITGFDGADVIDLANVAFGTASISYHANAGGSGGTLTISDGAQIAELSLVGNYSATISARRRPPEGLNYLLAPISSLILSSYASRTNIRNILSLKPRRVTDPALPGTVYCAQERVWIRLLRVCRGDVDATSVLPVRAYLYSPQ